MEREVDALGRLLEKPARPFHALIGGAKVSGKLEVLDALLSRCQAVLVGGGMANTFLAAKGTALGKSLVEEDQIANAKRIIDRARTKRVRLMAVSPKRSQSGTSTPRTCRSSRVSILFAAWSCFTTSGR